MVSDLRNIWQVTIVDSLPYIWPDDEISLELRTAWRENVFEVIRANALDVVLCMWKDNKGVSHDMETIGSIGVGKKFSALSVYTRKTLSHRNLDCLLLQQVRVTPDA